jgi:heptosyltransferase-2
VITRWLAPLAELLQRGGGVIPFDRGTAGLMAATRALRRSRHERGVLLPPSFSSALMFRLGGVTRLRGLPTDSRTLLLDDIVPIERVRQHRVSLYHELVTGERSAEAATPVLPLPTALRDQARALAGAGQRPIVALFPGSNAPARRWPEERFAGVARGLGERGATVVVLGARGEADLARRVAGDVAINLAGRTTLPVLAALLGECDILVTNDSGPMHLAAAAGTRVLVVSGPADTRETGPCGSGHVYLQRLDLPCVPCVKNQCPRSGAGFMLPEAEQECLRLIEIQDVLAAADRMLRS